MECPEPLAHIYPGTFSIDELGFILAKQPNTIRSWINNYDGRIKDTNKTNIKTVRKKNKQGSEIRIPASEIHRYIRLQQERKI
jgi:hypothetical protein